jgi:hypothetical protein
MFYRVQNNKAVIFNDDGSVATKIDANVYAIDGQSVRYEHPEGIALTITDAEKIGIKEE